MAASNESRLNAFILSCEQKAESGNASFRVHLRLLQNCCNIDELLQHADVAELVDALDLGSSVLVT